MYLRGLLVAGVLRQQRTLHEQAHGHVFALVHHAVVILPASGRRRCQCERRCPTALRLGSGVGGRGSARAFARKAEKAEIASHASQSSASMFLLFLFHIGSFVCEAEASA